jgi:hypothetical protein
MDARACAFRKKVLVDVGMFSTKCIAADGELSEKLKGRGRIVHPNVNVLHLHPIKYSWDKIRLLWRYAVASGQAVRVRGFDEASFWLRLGTALPIIGLIPIWFRFHIRDYSQHYLLYFLVSPIAHVINVVGFWAGFIKGGNTQ